MAATDTVVRNEHDAASVHRAAGVVLRKAKVDLGKVQEALGHASADTTAAIYDHSDCESLRHEFNEALMLGFMDAAQELAAPAMAGVHADPMQPSRGGRNEGHDASGNPRNNVAFEESGRLDL